MTKRPRLPAVACLILGLTAAGEACVWFWMSSWSIGYHGGVFGVGVVSVVLAVLAVIVAVLGFRIAAPEPDAPAIAKQAAFMTILVLVVAVVGDIVAGLAGLSQGDLNGVSAAITTTMLGLTLAFTGAVIRGTAAVRARGEEPSGPVELFD